MNASTRRRLVLVAIACAAIAGCRNDDVKTENNAAAAPATASKAGAPQEAVPSADCSIHEAQIVKLAGELAVSEAKAADLQDRIDELDAAPKMAKTKVCQACPEQEQAACPTVAEAPAEPADVRAAAECVALDRKFEARYRFLSKTVAELEVENYLNEHAITELEKTVGKAKK